MSYDPNARGYAVTAPLHAYVVVDNSGVPTGITSQSGQTGALLSSSAAAGVVGRLTGTFYSGAPSGATTVTGITTEATLASVTIPGGSVGPRGSIRVHLLCSVNNDASVKTLRVKLGNTTFASSSLASVATTSGWVHIYQRGVQNSQVCHPSIISSLTSSGAAVVIGAEDLSTDKLLTITGQLADGTDSMTLEAWSVEILQAS